MHKRSLGLSLFGGLAIIVAACGGGATPTPSAASQAPASQAASSAPGSAPASAPASQAATSNLKIGVVTDIGTLNDKNYNEYSFKGAGDAATKLGAPAPKALIPKSASEYPRSVLSAPTRSR